MGLGPMGLGPLVELVVEAAIQPIVLPLPPPLVSQVVREEEELLAEVKAVGSLGGILASHVDHLAADLLSLLSALESPLGIQPLCLGSAFRHLLSKDHLGLCPACVYCVLQDLLRLCPLVQDGLLVLPLTLLLSGAHLLQELLLSKLFSFPYSSPQLCLSQAPVLFNLFLEHPLPSVLLPLPLPQELGA